MKREKLDLRIKQKESPNYPAIMLATVRALKDMGGLATNDDISKQIIKNEKITEKQQSYSQKGDKYRPKFEFALTISRSILKRCGVLENPDISIWKLTDAGLELHELEELELLYKEDTARRRKKSTPKKRDKKKQQEPPANKDAEQPIKDDEPKDLIIRDDDWKTPLLRILGEISPTAFEHLCQRILREMGLFNVEVRGGAGDGGIDGIGFLRVEPVSFKVLFQCKRYTGNKVGPKEIRDFRGGVLGNDAKGLLITTNFFTEPARNEAIRDNTPAIDLIDGYRLCDLLKKHNLGIKTDSDEIIISRKWFNSFNTAASQDKKTKRPAKQKESKKRSPFNFDKSKIREGSKITFFNQDTQREDKTKVATVKGGRKIEFENRPGSLTKFAQEIMQRKPLRGPEWWMYKNKVLTDRRDRMRNENK